VVIIVVYFSSKSFVFLGGLGFFFWLLSRDRGYLLFFFVVSWILLACCFERFSVFQFTALGSNCQSTDTPPQRPDD